MKRFGASLAAVGCALVLFAARETRADPIPSCLTFSAYLYYQAQIDFSDPDVYKGKVGKVRVDTKALLTRLQAALGKPDPFPAGSCIEVVPVDNDGSATVRVFHKKSGQEWDVSPYIGFASDLTHDFFSGSFDTDDDAERGSSQFPVQMTINLPGLSLVLEGLATESSTAGPLDDVSGLQKKTNSTKAKLFGQGTYQAPGAFFPEPALADGSVTLAGKGEVPDDW